MSARRILSCILIPAYLSSCTAWHVQYTSPAQLVQEKQPSQIRVTTADNLEVILDDPRVSGDTLIGHAATRFLSWGGSVYAVSDTGSVLEIPLADLSSVALKKIDAQKSLTLAAGIVAAYGVLVLALLVLQPPFE